MKKYVYLVNFHLHFVDREINISPFCHEEFKLDKPIAEREMVKELEEKMVSWYKSMGAHLHNATFLGATLLRVEGEDDANINTKDRCIVVERSHGTACPKIITPVMTKQGCVDFLIDNNWCRAKLEGPSGWARNDDISTRAFVLSIPSTP